MLTGLRFNGWQAVQYGLVHIAVPRAQLDEEVNALIARLSSSGPQAMRMVKELVHNVPRMSLDDARSYTAKMIADLRTSDEGQEGIAAFLQNRKPKWAK
jgi:methylglutaconyl-CoA hydratase